MIDPFYLLSSISDVLPHPHLFLSIRGSHCYGCASPRSDIDVCGVHILPLAALVTTEMPKETISATYEGKDGITIDFFSHDVRKFGRLLLAMNGNAYESLFSPLPLSYVDGYMELRALARDILTQRIGVFYENFARDEWKKVQQTHMHERVKHLLSMYRLLLTGIHVHETGRINSRIHSILQNAPSAIQDHVFTLVESKVAQRTFVEEDEYYQLDYELLQTAFSHAREGSVLPLTVPDARERMDAFLLKVRLQYAHTPWGK